MKKLICVLAVLTLLFSSVPAFADTATSGDVKDTKDSDVYYHLDTGVYVLPYLSGKAEVDALGSTKTITAKLDFPQDIQVLDVYPALEKFGGQFMKAPFSFESSQGGGPKYTWNIPNKAGSYKDTWVGVYVPHLSKGQSVPQWKQANGKHFEFTYDAILDTVDPANRYDVAKAYRKTCDTTQALREIVTTEYGTKTVSAVDQKKAEQLINASRKSYRQYVSVRKKTGKYSKQSWDIWNKHVADREAYYKYMGSTKTISVPIQKKTAVMDTVAEGNLDKYEKEILKFWNVSSIDAMRKLGSAYVGLADGLKRCFEESPINDNAHYYLVFTANIIKYKKLNTTCTKCGDPIKPNGPNYCTKDNCAKFGTEGCGCYVPADVFNPSGSCKSTFSWTETKSHTYTVPGDPPKTKTCHHKYTYTATVTKVNAKLTAAHPAKGKKQTTPTFKSGYGFNVNYEVKVTVKQTGDSGSCGKHKTKAHSATVTVPSSAYVTTGWSKITKELKQPSVVMLAGSNGKFTCAPNSIAPNKAKLIFTDIDLSGTGKAPKKHSVKVTANKGYVSYGGKKQELCLTTELPFIICGNMYEDDWTVDRLGK